jgi:hypothetical protein
MPISRIEYNYPDGWVNSRSGRDPVEELGIRLVGTPQGTVTLMYADIPGQSWTEPRLELARQYVQDAMDNRIDRASLPADHPYIVDGDPALDWLFWDGTDVVERLTAISTITWEGYPVFTIFRYSRRAWNDAHEDE